MLRALLDASKLTVAFQPIVHLASGDVYGHEVFGRVLRAEGEPAISPSDLLEEAAGAGQLMDLDYAWRQLAVEAIARNHASDHLTFFLNVDTRILDDPRYAEGFTRGLLDRHGIPPSRIVLEMTERDAQLGGSRMTRVVASHVEQGFRIALDDLGAGYATLSALLQIRPQLLKLDRELVAGMATDPVRRNLVRALADFAQRSGIMVVAEGIETLPDLRALLRAGVSLGQGYLIAHPADRALPPTSETVVVLRREAAEVERTLFASARTLEIGAIAADHPTVSPSLSGDGLVQKFRAESHRVGFPVVDERGAIAGLVMRDRFLASLGGRFGYALHADRPISLIMDRLPVRVEASMPLEQVSRLATTRTGLNIYDLVLVERDGRFVGVVTVRALLSATTELEIQHAAYASPLTGLPGNVVIEQRIGGVLQSERDEASFVYADLDNFKAYNDVYGFAAGDDVIRLLATVLAEAFDPNRFPDAFLGHLGGDDFVVVAGEGPVEEACARAAALFDDRVRNHYAPADLARGGIVTTDRRGVSTLFPVMGASLAVVSRSDLALREVHEVGRLAAELKHRAKQEAHARGGGSGWVRERRGSGVVLRVPA